jgi:hypothetical protein
MYPGFLAYSEQWFILRAAVLDVAVISYQIDGKSGTALVGS